MRQGTVLTLVSAVCLTLVACESERSISLSEARSITADFSGQAFVPPPRSIEDVTALLDSQKEGSDFQDKWRPKADATPPPNANARTLANFYNGRGRAAHYLGRETQRYQDMTLAARYQVTNGARRSQTLSLLAWSHLSRGDYRSAFETMKRARALNPDGSRVTANLANLSAWVGELEAARGYRRELAAIVAKRNSGNLFGRRDLASADAVISSMEGRYGEAISSQKKVLAAMRSIGDDRSEPNWYAGQLYQLADYQRRQGNLSRAERTARAALELILNSVGRDMPRTGKALAVLARILRAQGRPEEAEILLRRSLGIYQRLELTKTNSGYSSSRKGLADAIMAQGGRWREAAELFDQIRETLGTDNTIYRRWYALNPNLPIANLKVGRVEEAARKAQEIYLDHTNRMGPKHYDTALARAVLAMTQAAQGREAEALGNFREAIPILTSRSRQKAGGGGVADEWRLTLILESYLDLLSRSAGGPVQVAEAFQVANLARGRSVQQAVSASAARASVGNTELADLARREQDAQTQIAALNAQLSNVLGAPKDERIEGVELQLRTRIDDLRAARATLMEEIEGRFPDYAKLINPKPASIEDARSALHPGETLISVYVSEKKTYVWVVPRAGAVQFQVAPLGRDALGREVGVLREALNPRASTLGEIPAFDVARANRLYARLFGPVLDGLLAETNNLVVVTHGPLGQLPLSVLPVEAVDPGPGKEPLFSRYRDIPWLIRETAITSVPSVSSLIALRQAPKGALERRSFIGFGDPYFSKAQLAAANDGAARAVAPTADRRIASRGIPLRLRAAPATRQMAKADLSVLPRLSDTRDEIRSIALALNADMTRDIFLGERATEEAVYETKLSGYRILAFATHGLVPGDLDGLTQPALALSSPSVSGGKNDGLLTMEEIMRLKLDADWVVLSACNTASADGAGAEAVSGLGRAFFYAGSRALLVSNWPVETTSARALTTDIFARQAKDPGLGRAEALRRAMIGLIDQGVYESGDGRILFSYAHPIFWAPFTIVGDGG